MAYHLTYYIEFNNQITERIKIGIYRKDIIPDQVTTLKCTFCNKKYINGQGDKYDTVISSELNFGVFIGINDTVDFDDILVSFTDEWKVTLSNDEQLDFVGFLVPNECKAAFRDKPYEIELTATDGLGYLRDIDLTDIDGANFSGTNFLIEYVSGCLKKTLLDLDIRVYCNIYEGSFPDRNEDSLSDMFNKAKLDYRTFLVDPIEFVKCYGAIELILKEGFSLFQWFGKWVIMRIGELQYSNGPLIWYTEYDVNGNVLTAQLEEFKAAQVAKQQILHPVNANQEILSRLSVKSAKTTFKYNVWPEIPLNNKFERGASFESGQWIDTDDFDNDGDTSEILGTYIKYNINDWDQGKVDLFDLPNPPLQATSNKFFRRSNYNIYGVEEERFVVGQTLNVTLFEDFWLRCKPIPVQKGSRVKVNVAFRTDSDFSSGSVTFSLPLGVYIVPKDGGNAYNLNNLISGNISPAYWKEATANLGPQCAINYGPNQDTRDWNSVLVESPPIPVTGTLYVVFSANGPISNVGGQQYFKDFSVDYFPYVAGGLSRVYGDYWFTEQNTNYRDVVDKEVGISDSVISVIKGALLQSDGETLTGRTWHRLNVSENREYKELLNIARYNSAYRRTWELSGSFGGTMFHPSGDQTIRQPLGFHKQFFFPNSSKLSGYFFQLVPPLTIDYVSGVIDATFVDCMKEGAGDGGQLGDLHEFKYIFSNG
jgi:hypothetical protein